MIRGGMPPPPTSAGGDIIKYGVSHLDRTLIENRLVDEYHLSIAPIRVARGKRAFEDVDPSLVRLTDSFWTATT
jgi:dihydrofolate reductase